MRTVDLRDHRVEITAARGGRRCEEVGVLRKESDDRDPAHYIIRPSRRAIRGVTPWTASRVDCWREERYFEAGPLIGSAGIDGHARERSPPPNHLRIVAGTG